MSEAALLRREKVYHSSGKDDWETPDYLFNELHHEFQFTIDGAASRNNAKLPRYWNLTDNALLQEWSKERVWLNPPYSQAKLFIQKAHTEWKLGCPLICLLLAARTDTKAWQEWIFPYAEVRFLCGRVRFVGAKHSAPFPSAIVIYKELTIERVKMIIREGK